MCVVSGLAQLGEVDSVGEVDDERVECPFPAWCVGAERSSSGGSDVAECEVEDLVDGVVGGERAPGFGDLAELVVQRLNSVGSCK